MAPSTSSFFSHSSTDLRQRTTPSRWWCASWSQSSRIFWQRDHVSISTVNWLLSLIFIFGPRPWGIPCSMILKLRVYGQACAWRGWPCQKHLCQASSQFCTLLYQFQGHSWSFGMTNRFSSSPKRSLKTLVTAFEIVYLPYFALMGLKSSTWLSESFHKMPFHWYQKPPILSPIPPPQLSSALPLHNHHHSAPLRATFYTPLHHLCTQTIQLHHSHSSHSSCDLFASPIYSILSCEPCSEAFDLSSENVMKNLSSIFLLLVSYSIALSDLKDDGNPCFQCVVRGCFDGIVGSGPKNVNVDFSFMVCLMGCCLHLHEQCCEYRNLIEKCLFDSDVMDWTRYHRCQRCTVMTAGARAGVIWLDFYIDFVFLSPFCWPLSRFQASWYFRLNGRWESFPLHSRVLNSCCCTTDFDSYSAYAFDSFPFCLAQAGSFYLARHRLQFQWLAHLLDIENDLLGSCFLYIK